MSSLIVGPRMCEDDKKEYFFVIKKSFVGRLSIKIAAIALGPHNKAVDVFPHK